MPNHEREAIHGPQDNDWEVEEVISSDGYRRLGFVKRDFDPQTGVTRELRSDQLVDPESEIRTITDIFPGRFPRRERYPALSWTPARRVILHDRRDDATVRKIKFGDDPSLSDWRYGFEIEMVLPRPDFTDFNLDYTNEGNFQNIEFEFRNPNPEPMPNLTDTPIETKMNELVRIFLLKGEEIFGLSWDLLNIDNLKPLDLFETFILASKRRDSLRDKSKTWSQNDFDRALLIISGALTVLLGPRILKGEYTQEQLEPLISPLTMMVLPNLPNEFPMINEDYQLEEVAQALRYVIESTLSRHYAGLSRGGSFAVGLKVSEDAPEQFNFKIWDGMRHEILVEQKVGLGETFSYDDWSYAVRDQGEGTLGLTVQDTRNNSNWFTLAFPKKVDYEEFDRLAFVEERIGWGKALETIGTHFTQAT